MNIWLDSEFNGWGGELISLALVAENGKEFYEVLDCFYPNQWVQMNVMPYLKKQPVSMDEFQLSLKTYLNSFESLKIMATWPDDFRLLMQMLIIGDGRRMKTPEITMVLLNPTQKSAEIMSKSTHNALEDARLLRIAHPCI